LVIISQRRESGRKRNKHNEMTRSTNLASSQWDICAMYVLVIFVDMAAVYFRVTDLKGDRRFDLCVVVNVKLFGHRARCGLSQDLGWHL